MAPYPQKHVSLIKSSSVHLSPSLGAEAALEQLGEGMLILNENWEIAYANAQAASYLGQATLELRGRSLWDYLPQMQTESSEFYRACQRAIATQSCLEFACTEWSAPRRSGAGYASAAIEGDLWIRLIPTLGGLTVYLREGPLRAWSEPHLAQESDACLAAAASNTTSEALLSAIAQQVQRCLPLSEIFQAAITGLRSLFAADRVLLYRIQSWEQAQLITQATAPAWPLHRQDETSAIRAVNSLQDWHEESYYPVADVDRDDLTATEQRILRQLRVKAQLVVPIFLEQDVWGIMALQQCSGPRQWQPAEIAQLKTVVTQMTVALQQHELRAQVDHLNVDLDQQVQERTTQLQKALDWEAMLKRITDKVRDSLDENQILQKAVQELALVMGMGACNAALYDLERQTSTIYYEYVTTLPTSQGRVAKMANYPEIYNQLLQAQQFQFCSITPNPVRGRVAMLTCPIFDNEGVLGDLWLVNHAEYAFSDREIRLVQQAANQCAIALRQARLYQAAQAQVAELEKINRLKDEFLSTVSHELRTPMTNMKMGILMLDVALKRRQDELQAEVPDLMLLNGKVAHYLEILRKECERESQLINDLLDLQRLDADTQQLDLRPILLQEWLPPLVGIFHERAQERQQRLLLDVPQDLPMLVTHVPGVERIVAELLNNACKYTPSDCDIRVQVRQVGARLELDVTNTGVEIPEAELRRVFDKFYRVPSNDPWKQGGTGLGLALVKKLSQHLGGDVQVSSSESCTSFTVELPFEPERARESQRLKAG